MNDECVEKIESRPKSGASCGERPASARGSFLSQYAQDPAFHPTAPAPFDERQMERDLAKEGLFREPAAEILFDLPMLDPECREPYYQIPEVLKLIQSVEELVTLLFRAGLDPWLSQAFSQDHASHFSDPLSERLAPRPTDLKHSQLMDLFRQGHFDGPKKSQEGDDHLDRSDPRLKLVAFLCIRALTTEDQVERLAPALSFKEFHRLQAQIHREVERTLPPLSRRFLKLWAALPKALKEALKLYRFENEGRKTQAEIARSLGIALDSFKERLNRAKATVLKTYPELPVRKNPPYWKELFRTTNHEFMGLFRVENLKRHPLYRIHPETGERQEIAFPARQKFIATPELRSYRRWEQRTSYKPSHDGVFSSGYAHMPNATLNLVSQRQMKEKREQQEQDEQQEQQSPMLVDVGDSSPEFMHYAKKTKKGQVPQNYGLRTNLKGPEYDFDEYLPIDMLSD